MMARADKNIHNQTLNASIPKVIRLAVIQRDGRRCVRCRATENLNFVHIVSPEQGGATVLGNLRQLCSVFLLHERQRLSQRRVRLPETHESAEPEKGETPWEEG